jgi:hypothetical protein
MVRTAAALFANAELTRIDADGLEAYTDSECGGALARISIEHLSPSVPTKPVAPFARAMFSNGSGGQEKAGWS